MGIKQYLVRPEVPLIVGGGGNGATEQQQQQQLMMHHNTSSGSQSPTPSQDGASTTGDVPAGTESPITEGLAAQILQSGRPLREVIDEVSGYDP